MKIHAHDGGRWPLWRVLVHWLAVLTASLTLWAIIVAAFMWGVW